MFLYLFLEGLKTQILQGDIPLYWLHSNQYNNPIGIKRFERVGGAARFPAYFALNADSEKIYWRKPCCRLHRVIFYMN